MTDKTDLDNAEQGNDQDCVHKLHRLFPASFIIIIIFVNMHPDAARQAPLPPKSNHDRKSSSSGFTSNGGREKPHSHSRIRVFVLRTILYLKEIETKSLPP